MWRLAEPAMLKLLTYAHLQRIAKLVSMIETPLEWVKRPVFEQMEIIPRKNKIRVMNLFCGQNKKVDF
jgi:hypothetical protein